MTPAMNAIELELMRLRLEAAAEEMGVVLQRTALSANIKERRDFSCAIFDAQGRLIAQAAHVPVHLGSMPESVRAVLESLGATASPEGEAVLEGRAGSTASASPEAVAPASPEAVDPCLPLLEGQTAIVNDPYAGGTHLPDITLVSPVYFAGRLIGYAANRAHHADVGGTTPGSMTLSRHIDEEGIRIPPSLLNEETLAKLLGAVRTPEERRGDLQAQNLANAAGAAALRRIAQAEGIESLELGFSALLEYAHRMTRDVIGRIPAGTYAAEDRMDDDGTGNGPPTNIRLKLTVASGKLMADFRESDAQAAGCINCPAAVTRSAVYYVVGCLLRSFGHQGVPFNDGCFQPVEVITRPGTVVHAVYPAAVVAGNTETSQRVVDVMLGALRRALPELIPAESYGTMSNVALGGAEEGTSNIQHRTSNIEVPAPAQVLGGPASPRAVGAIHAERIQAPPSESPSTLSGAWTYYETIAGGSGAGPAWDGESGVQCHMTNTLNTPAEALEMQYPLRVRRFELREGSGGPGTHRGGDGIVREIEALADCEGTILSDRRRYLPGNGSVGRNSINGREIGGKAHIVLKRGDVLCIETPGGGGWSA